MNVVANRMRGEPPKLRRERGVLSTMRFGSAPASSSLRISGRGSAVTVHGNPGFHSMLRRSTAQNRGVNPSASGWSTRDPLSSRNDASS